jgi:hypothetical protein
MRVQSLSNNFMLRQLPYAQENDALWLVRITGNDPDKPFTFAVIVLLPTNGDIAITVGIIPPVGAIDVDDPEATKTSIEPLLCAASHADHSYLAPFEYGPAIAANTLREAAESGDAAALQRLLSNADDTQREELIRTDFRDGCTALYIAALKGHVEVVRALLSDPITPEQIDAQLEAKNKNDWTPLHLAAQNGKIDVVRVLLGHPVTSEQIIAQLEATNKYGNTALHIAAEKGHVEVIEILLASGADIETQDRWGRTPLHLVVCLKATSEDSDGSERRRIGTDITRMLLKKLQDQGKQNDISTILRNDVIMNERNASELEEWKAEVQKPVNEWYRRLLQDAGVDVDAILAK